LRAIKLPFTKRITVSEGDESEPRKAVSNLLSFLAAIVAGGVNELGVDGRSGSRLAGLGWNFGRFWAILGDLGR
jgi:hypothetical protein